MRIFTKVFLLPSLQLSACRLGFNAGDPPNQSLSGVLSKAGYSQLSHKLVMLTFFLNRIYKFFFFKYLAILMGPACELMPTTYPGPN